MKSFLMEKIVMFLTIFFSCLSWSNPLTQDMEKFLTFAVQKNGDLSGFTKKEVEEALGIHFINQKMDDGVISYESARVIFGTNTPVYVLTLQNNSIITLDFNFTENATKLLDTLLRLRTYNALFFPRQQVNGLAVYYFEGKDTSKFMTRKRYWLRLYECSSDPEEHCIKNIELIFAKKDKVFNE